MVAKTKACEECTRNCQLIHYKKMDLSPSVTRFFRVLIGKDFLQFLLLPKKFADTVRHLVDQETKLEDSDGVQWKVTLSSVNNSLAFKRGWKEFSLDHNLQAGDFLVFNYIKGAYFVVQIFGRSCCEKVNSNKNGLPCKRARPKQNLSAQDKPFEKPDINAMKRHSSSDFAMSESNLEISHSQPTSTNITPISKGGNVKWSCLDSSFDMVMGQDAGPGPGEDRMWLYDLSSFEMQEGKKISDIKKGTGPVQDTSNKSQTQAIMRSQGEADKDSTGTTDLNLDTFEEQTEIGMIVDDYNLACKDYIILDCEKSTLADLSSSLYLCPSSAELGKNGDNMSSVGIQLQNAERSNQNYDWSSTFADEGACFIGKGQGFTGDFKKKVKREQLDTRQAHHHAKRLRGLEPPTVKESGGSSSGPRIYKPVKLEPVDSLDMSSSVSDALTCLAIMDGRHYLELPAKLPAITYRKGSRERKSLLLQDQERRFWPALYYDRSGFHVLVSGWDKFNQENRIRAGDHYVFQVEDVDQGIYKVDVSHQ